MDTADRPVPVRPDIYSVEIIPDTVLVTTSGASFHIRARLRDHTRHIVSEDYGLEQWMKWEWDPLSYGGTLPPIVKDRYSAYVTTPTVTGLGVTELAIVLTYTPPGASENEQLSTRAAILLRPSDAATGDRVVNDPRATGSDPPDLPALALFDGYFTAGDGNSVCMVDRRDRPIAVVGTGPVQENLVGDCPAQAWQDGAGSGKVRGAVAFFAPGKEMGYGPVNWTSNDKDRISFQQVAHPDNIYHQPLGPPRDLEMKIWLAPNVSAQFATDDIGLASWIFDMSLAGVAIPDPEIEHRPLPSIEMGPSPWNCEDIKDQLPEIPDDAFGPDKLNVFYTDKLFMLNDEGDQITAHGRACLPGMDATDERRDLGGIVIVEWTSKKASTMAHELGHMLGLIHPPLPWAGHTRDVGGFHRMNNLMWVLDDYPREYVSVGQVFRMNRDKRSWLNQVNSSGIIFECWCNPYINTPRDPSLSPQQNYWCPKLWTDIARANFDTVPPFYNEPACQ